MDWEYFGMVICHFLPLLQGQMRIVKLKRAYNSLIIGPTGLAWLTDLLEIKGCESSSTVRFDL